MPPPKKTRRQTIPSADLLEGLNGQMQRSPYMINAVPHEAAVTRAVGTPLLEQNDEWELQRRYMQLEGLLQLVDNQPARLSALLSLAATAQPDEPVDLHHSAGRDP